MVAIDPAVNRLDSQTSPTVVVAVVIVKEVLSR
jgi:hypothetical protein